ncbi:3-isopropylmalate dehydratase [Pseudomonas sp. SDO52101_S400]
MRSLIAAVAIAVLNGCASPPSGGDVGIAPANRLLAYQSEDRGHDARITVIREGDVIGAGCLFAIFIDGKLAARLAGDERASFYVKPGRRLVGVGPDPEATGRCGGSSAFKRELATWTQIGENQTFRVVLQPMMDIRASSY